MAVCTLFLLPLYLHTYLNFLTWNEHKKKHNARPNIIIQRITATSADIASHPRLNLWSLVPLQRIMDHCLCFSCRFQTFLSKLSVNRPLHQGTFGTFLCRNRLFVAVVVVFLFCSYRNFKVPCNAPQPWANRKRAMECVTQKYHRQDGGTMDLPNRKSLNRFPL